MSKGQQQVKEGAETGKTVRLFSIYPGLEMVVNPARYKRVVKDNGEVERFPVPGKMIVFKNNFAEIPAELAEKLKPTIEEEKDESGRVIRRSMITTHPLQRSYGITWWTEEDFMKMSRDRSRAGRAKMRKLRAEIERRRALFDEQVEGPDYFEIMEGRGKAGKLVITESYEQDFNDL